MIYTTLKQLAILLISSIGLYYSGLHLITIPQIYGIKSSLDALSVMMFFTCIFPFLILTVNLSIKLFKYFLKLTDH